MNPFGILLLLFLVVPLVEIYLLIQAGGIIGALNTVALVVLTAVAGAWLLRLQGLATLRRVQRSLDQGVLPETELVEGVLLLVAGALLLTPGFVTDLIGFVLLVPATRGALARGILARGVLHVRQGVAEAEEVRRTRDGGGRVIEGEAERDPEPHDRLD
ncbi:MAG: FxsA family protein [Gammaproteobacteria bacterium]|nr:FxsA family protein [Gammaproteobacteria bacterium]